MARKKTRAKKSARNGTKVSESVEAGPDLGSRARLTDRSSPEDDVEAVAAD